MTFSDAKIHICVMSMLVGGPLGLALFSFIMLAMPDFGMLSLGIPFVWGLLFRDAPDIYRQTVGFDYACSYIVGVLMWQAWVAGGLTAADAHPDNKKKSK
jgi:hypothetical protein